MEKNYLINKTACNSCYNTNRRKNNKNALIQNQQPKTDNVTNNTENGTLVIGFSNCGKNLINEVYSTSKTGTSFKKYKFTKSLT